MREPFREPAEPGLRLSTKSGHLYLTGVVFEEDNQRRRYELQRLETGKKK